MRLPLVASVCLVLSLSAVVRSAGPPKQLEGPISVRAVNGGKLAQRYLEDKGGGQDAAVWIADETKTVKGVLLHLHQGGEAWREDFQEFCRSQDFALFGSLIRWADFETVLPDQLAKLGQALGHPEIANVPWACIGGSRNVGALMNLTRLSENHEDRILCLLFNGGPGTGFKRNPGEDAQTFRNIPILAVNGSADPFVHGMQWQKKQYPQIRKLKLPYGVGVDWNCGHAPEEAGELWYPFIEAAVAQRYPADADPRKGPIRLKPFRFQDGWLVGPVDWENTWGPKAAPVGKWQGPGKQTVWLPGEDFVEIWRAFHNRPGLPEPVYADGQCRLASQQGLPAIRSVEYFADGQSLGSAEGTSPLATDKLTTGCWTIWAKVTTADGKVHNTPTALVINGKTIDYRQGKRAAQLAATPLAVLQADDGVKTTLAALEARRRGADAWVKVFEDTFDKTRHEDWYNYYKTEKVKRPRGHEDDRQEIVDGAMQLYSQVHAVAMLPYDWPRDVVIEYRAKSVSEKICDLSVILSGNAGGTDFPWRSGMMYQFGAHFNQGSFFLVHEQPHRNWQPYDSGARIKPGQWHTVRIERLGNTAKAFIDGKLANTREITPHDYERFYGQKIGLYTFSSTARFDDFKVYVRGYADNAPPLPPDQKLDAVVAVLVEKLADPFAQQRHSAWRLLRENSFELGDAMQRAMDAGKVQDESARKRIEGILAGRRPGR